MLFSPLKLGRKETRNIVSNLSIAKRRGERDCFFSFLSNTTVQLRGWAVENRSNLILFCTTPIDSLRQGGEKEENELGYDHSLNHPNKI